METTNFKEVIQFSEVINPGKVFTVESLRKTCYPTRTVVELRHTKANLIELDEEPAKPVKLELWDSGTCTLWYSRRRGKSWGQRNFPTEIKIIN